MQKYSRDFPGSTIQKEGKKNQYFPHKYSIYIKTLFILITLTLNSFGNYLYATNFSHISAKIGNVEYYAKSVIEDTLGYHWLDTNDGLLKFDGYDFRLYTFNDIFDEYFSASDILGLAKNANGSIFYIATNGMIAQLTTSGQFEVSYLNTPEKKQELTSFRPGRSLFWFGTNSGTLSGKTLDGLDEIVFNIQTTDETIVSISEEKNKVIWFSTNKGRIFKGDISTGLISELTMPFNKTQSSTMVTTDASGNLWIGTKGSGLYYYNIGENKFTRFHTQATLQHRTNSNMITCIFCDSKGLIWVGTDGGGLNLIDPKTFAVEIFTHSGTNNLSLHTNTVLNVSETDNSDIWVFTNYGKINIMPRSQSTARYCSGSVLDSPTRVISVLKSQRGELWVGTDGVGITRYDEKGNAITQYVANSGTAHGLPGNYIQAMVEDRNGIIWIGTYQNGLAQFDSAKKNFKPFPLFNKEGVRAIDIRTLFIDSQHRIWIGSNIGLFALSLSGDILAHFPYNYNNGLNGSFAEVFIEDEKHDLWIGLANGGLALLQEKVKLSESSFQTFQLINSTNQRENSIRHGTTDKNGHLYLTNHYTRLIKFDTNKRETVAIEGFNNDQVHSTMSIVATDSTNLWVSRISGISHLNLTTSQETHYNWRDGIQKGNFLSGSVTTDDKGLIYFGGIEGVNYFDPDSMPKSKNNLQLYINHFEVLNRDAFEIIPTQLGMGIEHLREVELKHDQSSFSFTFAVITNQLDPEYFYTYRLKNYDDNWTKTTIDRTATFTKIPPGNYIFEVKAGTKRDTWDINSQQIQIRILPSVWLTWWAYLTYAVLTIAIGAVSIYYTILWARMKKNMLKEKWKNEQNKELYDMKMNFFAKMSHEIQTPLTLIISPIDNMINRAEGNLLLQQRLQIIRNNAQRLSRISQELMTVRNIEMKKLKLRASYNNIYLDINDITLSFMEQARFKNIEFTFECTDKTLMVWYDKDKLEHIMYNLLSNAFKYTQREGKVMLSIEKNATTDHVFIKVSDTGIGIPESDLKTIFDLFYQSPNAKPIGGTGIGLALCQELVSLHQGRICVLSKELEGSTFTIELPLGNAHLKADEIIQVEQISNIENTLSPKPDAFVPTPVDDLKKHKDKHLLIVEDNYELSKFLNDTFSQLYHVRKAENGKEALLQIEQQLPDIILSDVMMPIMDGITLCKEVKGNVRMRHIPIILLTAKNSTSTKLEGLQYGALEYMNKPFNVNELKLKINNIIETQSQIIKQFRNELLAEVNVAEAESPDQVFIDALICELEKNYQNSEFKLEELAEPLHMSYSNIFRKFQSLTGKTLVDYMRFFRLKKAASLIKKYNYTIAEIAFLVGFNDSKYFTKCFKKEFNLTPKEFKQNSISDRSS
ncbi:ATP-binding protein [Saccharicrinis sp. GN24d3]|uniref:ATP-binding protein n=1 Tax=Saccharicrinis sp. GN24d3 TaxID=3458416 RepID=UPI004036EE5B